MADSNITKRALATSLKELMEEKPFEKINVGDICEKCDMNRKSFYYHFKDKYDLVNWIFDTEFISVAHTKNYADVWDLLSGMSSFFYENRNFYRKALGIKGQNSFSDHFKELILPVIANRIQSVVDEEVMEFQVTFIADAVVIAIQRWLIENSTLEPEEFVRQIKLSIKYIIIRYKDMEI